MTSFKNVAFFKNLWRHQWIKFLPPSSLPKYERQILPTSENQPRRRRRTEGFWISDGQFQMASRRHQTYGTAASLNSVTATMSTMRMSERTMGAWRTNHSRRRRFFLKSKRVIFNGQSNLVSHKFDAFKHFQGYQLLIINQLYNLSMDKMWRSYSVAAALGNFGSKQQKGGLRKSICLDSTCRASEKDVRPPNRWRHRETRICRQTRKYRIPRAEIIWNIGDIIYPDI